MTKIGIVGSRRRNSPEDKELIRQRLLKIFDNIDSFNQRAYKLDYDPDFKKDITLVSGGCPLGADRFAEELAVEFNIPIIIHYPDKSKLDTELIKKNPRVAYAKINYDRNTLIAQDVGILIACVAPDRKGGTENTIKKYLKLGKEGLIIL